MQINIKSNIMTAVDCLQEAQRIQRRRLVLGHLLIPRIDYTMSHSGRKSVSVEFLSEHRCVSTDMSSSGAGGSGWPSWSRLSLQTFHTTCIYIQRHSLKPSVSSVCIPCYTFSPLGPADPSGPTGPGAPCWQKTKQIYHQSSFTMTS